MRLHRRAVPILLCALLGGATVCAAAEPVAPDTRRYIVRFKPERFEPAQRALSGRARAVRHRFERHAAAAVEMDPLSAAELGRDPAVLSVEPDVRRYPVSMIRARPSGADLPAAISPLSTETVPYGVSLIQARGFAGVRTADVRTCVIDSGYDLGHEDMPAKMRVTGSDDIGGTGRWSRDGNGHGTHVAGTINARDNTVGVIGVFPGAKLHIVRVFGKSGYWTYSSDLVAALERCRESGSRIVSMSLGGDDSSTLEREAFAAARDAGVLSVAAAGNDGNTRLSYPASYESVLSVAAVDHEGVHAPFSNRNSRVALAAPGVSVLSTVPRGTVREALMHSPIGTVAVFPMDNFATPTAPVVGRLVDCGLAETAADCGDATGALCLIERGTFTFAVKARSCQTARGVGAVVFNRVGETGPVFGTLGTSSSAIPVVGTDRPTGLALREDHLESEATLEFNRVEYDYDYYSGTSMATPHVAGAAALLWSRHPLCTGVEIRTALTATALDLGVPGRDPLYGHGLVQVRAANKYLFDRGCAAG